MNSVSSSDAYEAFAGMTAIGGVSAILLYPYVPDGNLPIEPGATHKLETLLVNGTRTVALSVDLRGIGTRGGWNTFCLNLEKGIRNQASDMGIAVPG